MSVPLVQFVVMMEQLPEVQETFTLLFVPVDVMFAVPERLPAFSSPVPRFRDDWFQSIEMFVIAHETVICAGVVSRSDVTLNIAEKLPTVESSHVK